MISSTSNFVTANVRCETCGHMSSLGNFVVDQQQPSNPIVYVCSHCRNPLKEKAS